MTSDISQRLPSDFPYLIEIPTRYADVDHLRHVNNIAIAAYYDEARARFTIETVRRAGVTSGMRVVTVQANVSFLAEVFNPGVIQIGTGISRIGTASYEISQALFQYDRCVGVCVAVFVNAPTSGSKSAPLPDKYRSVLSEFLLKDPAAV